MYLPTQSKDVHAQLANAYNTGEITTILAMYDFSGVFVAQPDKAVSGKSSFEEAIKGILSLGGKMEIKTMYCLEAGDLALGRSEWIIRENGITKISAKGIEVMKRQPDGTWKIVFDHAFGADMDPVALVTPVA